MSCEPKLSDKDEAFVQRLHFDQLPPFALSGDPSCDKTAIRANAMGAEAWKEELKNAYRKAIIRERRGDAPPRLTIEIDQNTPKTR